MKRVDQLKAVKLDTGEWRLDPHSALYMALNRRQLTASPYVVNISEEHRPDLVALNTYGDPSMWWVIATYNGLVNAVAETVMGMTLQIPLYNEVDELFKQSKVKSRVGDVVEI